MDKQSILKTALSFLKKEIPNLQAVYAFGSIESEYFANESDLDLAIKLEKPLENTQRWKLQESLASRLKRNVDLVDMNSASLVFQFEILSTGRRLYCIEKNLIESYETLVYSRYLDFNQIRKPILDAIRERGTVYGS